MSAKRQTKDVMRRRRFPLCPPAASSSRASGRFHLHLTCCCKFFMPLVGGTDGRVLRTDGDHETKTAQNEIADKHAALQQLAGC